MKKQIIISFFLLHLCVSRAQEYIFSDDRCFPVVEFKMLKNGTLQNYRPVYVSAVDTLLNETYRSSTLDLFCVDVASSKLKIRTGFSQSLYAGIHHHDRKTSFVGIGDFRIRAYIKPITFYAAWNYGGFQPRMIMPVRLDSIWSLPQYGLLQRPADDRYVYYHSPSIRLRCEIFPELSAETGFAPLFIGNGYRSLLLSDNHYSYPYVRFDFNTSGLQFLQLYAWTKDASLTQARSWSDANYKFVATHVLTIRLLKKLWFSLFETVVCPLYDSTMRRQMIEWNYLLPVVMYRPVDFSLGSNDNLLLGANIVLSLRDFIFYAQFLLDEFYLNEMRNDILHALFPSQYSTYGAWVNKYAWQAGFKKYFIKNLEKYVLLQEEFNVIRPYTYSHRDVQQNYTHLGASLAHPYGANLLEWLQVVQFSNKRFLGNMVVQYLLTGMDSVQTHVGRDIHQPTYDANIPGVQITPVQYYGNTIGQGIPMRIVAVHLNSRYFVNLPKSISFDFQITGGYRFWGERRNVFYQVMVGFHAGNVKHLILY